MGGSQNNFFPPGHPLNPLDYSVSYPFTNKWLVTFTLAGEGSGGTIAVLADTGIQALIIASHEFNVMLGATANLITRVNCVRESATPVYLATPVNWQAAQPPTDQKQFADWVKYTNQLKNSESKSEPLPEPVSKKKPKRKVLF